MDFDPHIGDVGVAAVQELCNKVALAIKKLVSETKDVTLHKDSFREFSKYISQLSILFQALKVTAVSESTRGALRILNSQLHKAHNVIRYHKSGSKLRLLLRSHSFLSQMQALSKDIADTISSLDLPNLNLPLELKSKTDQIINNLGSMEFRSAAATDAIATQVEISLNQSGKNQDHAIKLLHKIADAVGASAGPSLVQSELALLKQEKEEMEAQKQEADALQLSQLIHLLYSTEMVTRPLEEQITPSHQHYPIDSFVCPLCNEVMTDPVAVICGHSFERKAIQEHFRRGGSVCPTCKLELPSQELTPNLSLQSSIEEWKQIDMDLKFQATVLGITSDCPAIVNKALEDMQVLMEIPRYRVKVSENGLVTKLVEVLKHNELNTKAALKCLCFLCDNGDNHKEAIVEAGAIRRIMKQLYNGEAELDAITILQKLSNKETLGERIGNAKGLIPLLVSLLHNNNHDVSQKAQKILQNLSSNIHCIVKMAEAGHYQPFIIHFNQGTMEIRASMAASLSKMQLNDNFVQDFEDKHFIHNLVQMLPSSSTACKSACLQSIKKLSSYPVMAKQFLANNATIPHLLGLISLVKFEPHWKKEATEILTSLVRDSQPLDFQTYPALPELQSQHNISLFLHLAVISESQLKVQFLQLLIVLSYKSETARSLVQANKDAVAALFSLLVDDQPSVRRCVMKLIYCTSDGHPAEVPLPPSPAKESAIKNIAAILACSPEIQERSTAAGIISRLPIDDIVIDETLCKTEALKAIYEIICTTDDEHNRNTAPTDVGESLLENSLAALLRYTDPNKPELLKQVGKLELYPLLVRVLSRGSSLAKQRSAIALAHLSKSNTQSIADGSIVAKQANKSALLQQLGRFLPIMSWCCSVTSHHQSLCCVHGAACSLRHNFCLIKADAVKPLVQTLGDAESGAAEAALIALGTLLTDRTTFSHAAATIVDSKGVAAILEVLEKGSTSAKDKALDLLQQILEHVEIKDPSCQRSERILISLLQDDKLKKKAALVLRQMKLIPEQSSYF